MHISQTRESNPGEMSTQRDGGELSISKLSLGHGCKVCKKVFMGGTDSHFPFEGTQMYLNHSPAHNPLYWGNLKEKKKTHQQS